MGAADALAGALIAAALILAWLYWPGRHGPAPAPRPLPVLPVLPAPPCPEPDPCPDGRCPPRRPRRPADLSLPYPAAGQAPSLPGSGDGALVGGPRHPDGTEADVDLPERFHIRNRGGSDGAGLCVFASMSHSGTWAEEPVFKAAFEHMFRYPGGGWPEKVDKVVERIAREKGLPKPDYLQVVGRDLEILKRASRSGLMPGVTYWRSPTGRYGGRQISHMVSLVHADERHFAVLDNNYPRTIEWMSPEQFRRTFGGPSGEGWAVIPLKPGPPPPPAPPRKSEGGNE